MVRRRAFLMLILAAGLTLSVRGASAATAITAKTTNSSGVVEHAKPVMDGSMTSLLLYMRDRLTIAYRSLRGTRIAGDPTDATGYHTDGISDGGDTVDPLGAKGGLGGAVPAQTRRPAY